MQSVDEAHKGHHHGEHHELVSITIDRNPYEIRPGEHPVTELKRLGHVPADYELDELVHGKLVPRPDNTKVHIKGCEVFISHPKDAASS